MLPDDKLAITRDVDHRMTAYTGSWQDEFFTMHLRKRVEQLVGSAEVGECVTLTTVVSIDNTTDWFYFDCDVCGLRVRPSGCYRGCGTTLYYCETCGVEVNDVTAKFLLVLLVLLVRDDLGSEAKFFLPDEVAATLLDRTADDILNEFGEDGEHSASAALLELIRRELLCKIDIASANLTCKKAPFAVDVVTSNGNIVDQFREYGSSNGVMITYSRDDFD